MVKWVKMHESDAVKPPFYKRKGWLWVGLVVAILIVGYLYLQEGEEARKVQKPKEESEQAFKEKTGFDERLRTVIQEDNYNKNQGMITNGYKFNDEYYLTVNQSGVFSYDDDYPGDTLLWVKEKDGKVETKSLTNGDKLLQVVLDGETPFFKQEGKTYIVFYEKEGNEEIGQVANGYVYEIESNGNIEKHYETKGHFHAAGKNRDGKLLLVEKVFTDTLNLYPMEWKDYKLKTYQLEGDEWTFLNEKLVSPMEEMEKQEQAKQEEGKKTE